MSESTESTGLRKRSVGVSEDSKASNSVPAKSAAQVGEESRSDARPESRVVEGEGWFLGCILVLLVVGGLAFAGYERRPLVVSDNAPMDRFSAVRAKEKVVKLSDEIGQRTFASPENVVTADWVWSEMNRLVDLGKEHGFKIEIERWRTSGTFNLFFYGSHTLFAYHDVENIALKICGLGDCSEGPFTLVNSHFDSALGSPGGSDAGGMVGVMLEVVSNIIHREEKLAHPTIFLFNGAEEPYCLAAHAFLSHPWWKKVAAFINLESSGAGGNSLLFRMTPGHNWLGRIYQRAVQYPFVFSGAQDVFERKVVPSNTDYIMWSDMGNVPGYDLANYRHGAVYHTARDTSSRCTSSFLQDMGDSTLDLITELTMSSELEEDHSDIDLSNPKLVVFDILRLFTVVLDERIANAMYAVAGVLLLRVLSFSNDRAAVFRCFLGMLLGFILAIAAAVVLGLGLGSISKLSWYARIWLVLPLYAAPSMLMTVWLMRIVTPRDGYTFDTGLKALSLVYMVVSGIFAAFRLRMSYMPASYALGALSGTVKLRGPYSVQMKFFITMVPIVVIGFPVCATSVETFAGVFGRSGVTVKEDAIMAGLVSFLIAAHFSLPIGCLALKGRRSLKGLTVVLTLAFVSALVWAVAQDVPYTSEYPKRMVLNEVRLFDDGGERSRIIVTPADSYQTEDLPIWPTDGFITESSAGEHLFGKVGSSVFDFFLPTAANVLGGTTLVLNDTQHIGKDSPKYVNLKVHRDNKWGETRKLSISVDVPGCSVTVFRIRAKIKSWSLPVEIIPDGDQHIFRTFFAKGSKPYRFDFEVEDKSAKIDVDLLGITHGDSRTVAEHIRPRVPDWVDLVSVRSAAKSFSI
ncbi:hypothetical protein NDN08_004765 [Rhodosorus marinus]|uniref:Peptidase M28 domain-containing protein n=1 Tax=Rhodosorus marinus TaxID=101924 RepID=A0AAV8UMD7_9RHOD|nr:hypothetical protein NDN08_004765 [Rhodosorus marinus]